MSFLQKIFGTPKATSTQTVLDEVLQNLISKSGLDLSYDIKMSEDGKDLLFDLYGADDELIKDHDGAFLNALQLFLKRVLQNKTDGEYVNIIVDSGTFREDADQSLLDLADKLKSVCLKKKKPVYFRAFPPRERKIIHQHLSEDNSVKSKSVGDGLFKKIKIFPAQYKSPKKNNYKNENKDGEHSNPS